MGCLLLTSTVPSRRDPLSTIGVPVRLGLRPRRTAPCCIAFLLLAAACSEGSAERQNGGVTPPPVDDEPIASMIPAGEPQPPTIRLAAGARYFERDGVQAPLLMRNVSAPSVAAFTPLFEAARDAGTLVVRLQLTQGFGYQTLGMNRDGAVLSSWVTSWDAVFDEAERLGLGIIPVFTLWGDWNDGTPALGWVHYDQNPLSSARGGPAASPADLFADTETQRAWVGWLATLVARWSARPNVVAWEVFSELDLATGVTEASATAFVERAHQAIREVDPWRPAYASTSDLPLVSGQPWQALWSSPGNDIASVHPYAEDLDRVAADRIRSVWLSTTKPVLVGESGLDAAPPESATLTSAPGAEAGLEHAIWAELTSGAASARALYWEDGYAVYYPATGLPLVTRYQGLEREAARWLAGKDFRGRAPMTLSGDPPLFGTAMADAEHVSGWARNAALSPPAWSGSPLARALVHVDLPPGTPDATWVIATTNPADGSVAELAGTSTQGLLSFEVTTPFESVAFDARRGEATGPVCPDPEDGACVGPIYALEVNGQSLFADPECPSARVQVQVTECRGTQRLSLYTCPFDGVTEPRSCVELTVDDVEGTPGGSGTYHDAAGAAFDVTLTEVELGEADVRRQTIRTGSLRGTFAPSGSTAAGDAFELIFSACGDPLSVCLL